MTAHQLVTDTDIDAYVTHVAKLAAIAAPGDPPPERFRVHFLRTHGVLPKEARIGALHAPCRTRGLSRRGSDLARHALAG